MEQWRWTGIGAYWVSNEGRVGRKDGEEMRVRRPARNSRGYMILDLKVNGVRKSRTVHSLVLEAFIGPKPTLKHEGNHKDGDRTNNRLSNLEWVTHLENMRHSYTVLGHKHARGEKAGRAKLTEEQVQEIRLLLGLGIPRARVARGYKLNDKTVKSLQRGETWGWLAVKAPKRSAVELKADIPPSPPRGRPASEKPKPIKKAELAENELFRALGAGVKVVFTPYAGALGNYYTRMDTGEWCTGIARRLIHAGRAARENNMLVPTPKP